MFFSGSAQDGFKPPGYIFGKRKPKEWRLFYLAYMCSELRRRNRRTPLTAFGLAVGVGPVGVGRS